jgi:hypothetical protein
LEGIDYSLYVDTFYMEGEQSIVIVGPERVSAGYGDCSELWNVLVRVDPLDDFGETNENNNCSLVAQIGWYHNINGLLTANDWNDGPGALRSIDGAKITLHKGFGWEETVSSDGGYFDFWAPYSDSLGFSVAAEMSIPDVIHAYDSITGYEVSFESGNFTNPDEFSLPIALFPFGYTKYKDDDSLFDAAANVLFGIEHMNNFLSMNLGEPYSLPNIQAYITINTASFLMDDGQYIVRIGRVVDWDLYYDRQVIAELGHVCHQYAIPPGIFGHTGCPPINHFPGFPTNESCAFVEGWSGLITALVPDADPYAFTSPRCGKYDIEYLNSNNIEVNNWLEVHLPGEGQDDEGATAIILYDMYDDMTPWGIDDADLLIEPFEGIYQTLQRIDINFSIIEFADNYMYWILLAGSDPDWESRRDLLCDMLIENKIDTSRIFQCEWLGYVCGDANGDGLTDVGDAVFLLCYIFENCGNPQPPQPMEAGDANCDGLVNIGDVVRILDYVFRSGPEPCCPG